MAAIIHKHLGSSLKSRLEPLLKQANEVTVGTIRPSQLAVTWLQKRLRRNCFCGLVLAESPFPALESQVAANLLKLASDWDVRVSSSQIEGTVIRIRIMARTHLFVAQGPLSMATLDSEAGLAFEVDESDTLTLNPILDSWLDSGAEFRAAHVRTFVGDKDGNPKPPADPNVVLPPRREEDQFGDVVIDLAGSVTPKGNLNWGFAAARNPSRVAAGETDRNPNEAEIKISRVIAHAFGEILPTVAGRNFGNPVFAVKMGQEIVPCKLTSPKKKGSSDYRQIHSFPKNTLLGQVVRTELLGIEEGAQIVVADLIRAGGTNLRLTPTGRFHDAEISGVPPLPLFQATLE